ncbi:hypothetical protein BKA70DRAFT_1185460 [Coprinopsis sp. MPI-PUGE-AT-0042]|nr:hypothetical protein BKA70DRAFT_1185460 [Coprinopsis sp. MPI-PUGE-AT-0042]
MEADGTNQNSRKRQRREGGAPESAVTRSTECWFEDGNLILQAEDVQFKTHRGLLARYSSVLRDMLSVPQPEEQQDGDDFVEGCPVVVLDDRAKHWAAVLTILYDGLHRFLGISNHALPFGLVDAMLRLGHKYEFLELQKTALDYFSRQFAKQEDNFYCTPNRPMDKDDDITFCYLDDDHSFNDVINLAISLRLNCTLPAIFLQALIVAKSPASFFESTKSASGALTNLPHDIQILLVQSHARLATLVAKNQFAYLTDEALPTVSCRQPTICNKVLRLAASACWNPTVNYDAAFDADHTYNLEETFCHPCRIYVYRIFFAGRTASWTALPGVFGLPAWEDLRNFAFD